MACDEYDVVGNERLAILQRYQTNTVSMADD